MLFLESPVRFLFFTGKGGVGKTSIACATAVHLAAGGRRVLLVSTDPASNVGQVFETSIGNTITPIPGVSGLDAVEIDPQSAAEQYRERIIGPVRSLLPEEAIASIAEQLAGSCTVEVASFNEFTDFLADSSITAGYDHVIFDTAPTGHTLRLLQLPGDWTGFLDAGGDASCLGPMSGLDKHRQTYANAVAALTDPTRTHLVLVARAQPTSLGEAQRTATELAEIGIHATNLVVNALLPSDAVGDDPLAGAIREREQRALADLTGELARLPRDQIGLKPRNMVGLEALRTLLADDLDVAFGGTQNQELPGAPNLDALVEELAPAGHGLIMCMGKGGVGKTTIAAAIAVRLADRGHRVHLTTTDPAAHLDQTISVSPDLPNLTISRVDPDRVIQEYRAHVMATKGASLDEDGRAALAEDLRSPCNSEIAVFQQFSHLVNQASRSFVVMDTAPTGHTLLLMDTTGAYDRDIRRSIAPGVKFKTPLMRLQDPEYTQVVLVTLPETTPVLEAEELAEDLARASITPWAWVVNQALSGTRTTSPLLAERAALEADPIRTVRRLTTRLAIVPSLAEEPVGAARLRALATHSPGALYTTTSVTQLSCRLGDGSRPGHMGPHRRVADGSCRSKGSAMRQDSGSVGRGGGSDQSARLLPFGRLVLSVEEVRHLWSFLHGDIMASGLRVRLRESLGLCPRHTWAYAVVEIELWLTGAGRRGGHQPFDVSVLYEDLLGRVATGLARPVTVLHRHPGSILVPRGSCPICADLVPAEVSGPRLGYAASNSAALAGEANTLEYTTRWCVETVGEWGGRVCPDCRTMAGAATDAAPGEDAWLCRVHLLARGLPREGLLPRVVEHLLEVRDRLQRLNMSMTVGGAPATPADDASWIEALGFFAGWALPMYLADQPIHEVQQPKGPQRHE